MWGLGEGGLGGGRGRGQEVCRLVSYTERLYS